MSDNFADRLRKNLGQVIFGKPEVLDHVLTCFLAGGHLLLEDVPGVGKTMLGRALARSMGLGFQRIQFTSDLLPADILGVSVFRPEEGTFEFKPGPIFANVILADELNRTPPRTQSSLLEALEDACVTVDGNTYDLAKPFFVIATQNPLEFSGTYPLPESELDRFLLCTRIGYPDRATERKILLQHRESLPIAELQAVTDQAEVLEERRLVREVKVDDAVVEYVLDVVAATRRDGRIRLGASPRAALALDRAVRALARVRGREYCTPDDVKEMAPLVLAHRIVAGGMDGETGRAVAEQILREILERTTVPT